MTIVRTKRTASDVRTKLAVALLAIVYAELPIAEATGFKLIHRFDAHDQTTVPFGSVIRIGDTLFGTTVFSKEEIAGSNDRGGGAIYSLQTDGSNFKVLRTFSGSGDDGLNPFNSLASKGNTLIVSPRNGGNYNKGTLASLNLKDNTFHKLHDFTGVSGDGSHPYTPPIIVGEKLYGLTFSGGTNNMGSLYQYDYATESLHSIFSFHSTASKPFGSLTQVNEWLYGLLSDHRSTAQHGKIFRYNPTTSAFEIVHAFKGNAEGGYPYDTLAFDGDRYLYGTALGYYPFTGEEEPLKDQGVIFRFDIVSRDYDVIHNFGDSEVDGSKPNSSISVASDGMLYGISHGGHYWGGESYEHGTLYRLQPDGLNFEILHTFNSADNGLVPMRSLTIDGDRIYGTTAFGGLGTGHGNGTVWVYIVPEPASLSLAFAALISLIAASRWKTEVTFWITSPRRGDS